MYRIFRRIARALERLGDRMTPVRCIVLVFLAVIGIGAALLSLPVSSRSGESCGFLTAVFTATSATCVTGLSLVDTYTQWSGFGQVVILALIQVGGLGFMTIVSIFLLMLRSRIGLKKRMVMATSLGLDSLDGIVRLIRMIIKGTLLLEGIGAVILTVRFWVDVPFGQALWMGIFHAVSAFCNAGFDILGRFQPGSSIAVYAADPVVNLVLMLLIILGGLGFFVWRDLAKNRLRWKQLTVYSRLVLSITGLLLLGGWILFALLEWNNPATLGELSLGQKLLQSAFQSVTVRTAGFAAFDQGALTEPSRAVCVIWMLIGGSSGSTAGGLKTVTVGLVLLSAVATMRGEHRVTVFHRTINQEQINLAAAVTVLVAALALGGATVICALEGVSFLNALYETASALGTVGLTAGLTPGLGRLSLWILIVFMFFGRVGIMTIGMGFMLRDKAADRYRYAETKLLIG